MRLKINTIYIFRRFGYNSFVSIEQMMEADFIIVPVFVYAVLKFLWYVSPVGKALAWPGRQSAFCGESMGKTSGNAAGCRRESG